MDKIISLSIDRWTRPKKKKSRTVSLDFSQYPIDLPSIVVCLHVVDGMNVDYYYYWMPCPAKR